jgi:hypothetical protein
MKNIDIDNHQPKHLLNESKWFPFKHIRQVFGQTPKIVKASSWVPKKPFSAMTPLEKEAYNLRHGYKNEHGKWIPGFKDRHPILKPLVPAAAVTGYVGADYAWDWIADFFTNTDFSPKVEESNSITNGNIIVESGQMLEAIMNLQLAEELVTRGVIQLNEVSKGSGLMKIANWIRGLGGKAAVKLGDKIHKIGDVTRPKNTHILKPKELEQNIKDARAFRGQYKDYWLHPGSSTRNPRYRPGYSDDELTMLADKLSLDSLTQKGLAPMLGGAQAWAYVEGGGPLLKYAADATGATDIWNMVLKAYNEADRRIDAEGDRELFGMDPDIMVESSGTNDIMLDEFSNVICEADMIPGDTMRSYIDIINGNSLNEGVLSWVANKLTASPKKFSADDFVELLKDTDVTVIVKTRDRLAKSIQNAGADPALSNEVKTLDNIISQRINNSRK